MFETSVTCFLREDAQAPQSRPTSRNSSFRSVMGYRTHPGVQYSSVRNHMPNARASGRSAVYTGGSNMSSPVGDKSVALQYDHEYGYPV